MTTLVQDIRCMQQSNIRINGVCMAGQTEESKLRSCQELDSQDQKPENEPIAIVGIGCRFPGQANSPEAFWQLLRNGIDAITEVPADRWNVESVYDPDKTKPGKTHSRWGGFIEKIDKFDAQFFGISPRKAARIDPQQRLLLEIAWEALEDGGQVPEHLASSNTGVFIGIYIHDYQNIQTSHSERNLIDAQTATGMAMSMAANCISYVFDFQGPSIAFDTACSSSLVAVHFACRSLWNGECSIALAGGVNVMLKPEWTISFSKARMLSPDGRCKSFDARANGFVRGEGAGIVVLKPLSAALADGDPIYAVIRGSGINQDGRTNGITVPNGKAQEALLKKVCYQAGVSPQQIQYMEAHGTGTAVGDPIEANALGSVLGVNRPPGNNCVVGSVKTNIGHLESAAGIAGLIKVALSLKHRQIPPNLHFHTPNAKIPFEELRLRVPQTLEPWPCNGNSLLLAGVNSFGFGGTNAHVLVEAAPQNATGEINPKSKIQNQQKSFLFPLSAKSTEALNALALLTHDFLTDEDFNPSVSISDICYSASLRRGHHKYRLAIVADSKQDIAEKLAAFLAGETRVGMSCNYVMPPDKKSKLAFIFSGMGGQWWAMGRQMLEKEPVFRLVIEQCDRLLREYTDWSLWEELTRSEETSRIDQTQIAQCSMFSLQVALAALWRSWGITPQAIVGHSVGEVAAACIAGVLSLEDAILVVFHRSRLQAIAAGTGKMLVVQLSFEEAEQALMGYETCISVAAVNSPSAVTLAGNSTALEEIARSLEGKQIFCRFLQVEVPYHSPSMEPLKAELVQSLLEIKPQTAKIPLFSTVTGQQVEGSELDSTYWGNNMREPVLFATAIAQLIQADYNHYLEISPHPVLANSIAECLAKAGSQGMIIPSLRRKKPDYLMMLGSLGKLYTLGYPVDWYELYPQRGNFVRLPSYPWQRQRYWYESVESQRTRLGSNSIFPCLPQSERQTLIEQLHKSGKFSESEMKLLPKLLNTLCEQNEKLPTSNSLPSSISVAEWIPNLRAIRDSVMPFASALIPHPELLDKLENLSIDYILNAFKNMGWEFQQGQRSTTAFIAEQLGVVNQQQRLLGRLLEILSEVGVLKRIDGQWEVAFVPEIQSPQERCSRLLVEYPTAKTELILLNLCASQLGKVLQGTCDPLQLLFSEETDTTLERLYQDSPTFVQTNAIVQKVICGLLKHLPEERKVRILEIGAGTGGTTVRLLPYLNPQQTEYTFTDIGRFFIPRMRQKLADYPFIQYQVLDIEKSPQQQGFATDHYDLIIAANVLHATRDLRTTLQHIRQLLVPGGMLVLLEGTAPRRWVDLIFGLLKGWWMFSDEELRPNYPLMSDLKWKDFLLQNGFAEVVSIENSFEDLFAQSVIIARGQNSSALIFNPDNSSIVAENENNILVFNPSPVPHLTNAELKAVNPQERHQMMVSYLAKQVARVLEISDSRLDFHAPLKNLGLDSLMAIELKSKLEADVGKVFLPVNTFQDMSLEQVTQQILGQISDSIAPQQNITQQHSNPQSEELIAIQPSGSQPPFICLHPGALDVSYYVDLVSNLGNERPFYALKPSNLDNYKSLEDGLFFPKPIEEVAAHCLKILHRLRPEGPYFLGGWSLGGYIAWEMCQQLNRKGQEVALLALFDVRNIPANDDNKLAIRFASYLGCRYGKKLPSISHQGGEMRIDERLRQILEQAIATEILPKTHDLSDLKILFQAYKNGINTAMRQIENYKPRVVYANRIVCFDADDGLKIEQPLFGLQWDKNSTYSQVFESYTIPGDHYTMLLEPNVRILAEKFKE